VAHSSAAHIKPVYNMCVCVCVCVCVYACVSVCKQKNNTTAAKS